jgi:excisionase family DNA binding protein
MNVASATFMRTSNRQDILTTGQVARICHVAPRTVTKWFDTGKLRGYRIPGSRDRRIPRPQLLAFMRAHGIPIDVLEQAVTRVVIVGGSEAVRQELEKLGRYQVHMAANRFEAGMLAQQVRPHVVVLETDTLDSECLAICLSIKHTDGLEMTRVVLATGDVAGAGAVPPFDDLLPRPYGLQQFASVVERATNIVQ